MIIKRKLLFISLSLLTSYLLSFPTILPAQDRSIDSLFNRMSVREKIAQLIIVSFSSDYNDKSTIEAEELIKKEGIGGVILMESKLTEVVKMINHFQDISHIPLLVTIDGEWGPSMRIDSLPSFPRQMQLGALNSDTLVYLMGRAIGTQLKRLGIDVNFAPDVDINSNPSNPVINTRSFGERREIVAKYGLAYMKGMQDVGVLGSAKHFPGHGDTAVDSHQALPVLTFSKERIDTFELYPFKALIEGGVDMVMVGHLQIPSLDSTGTPSSISFPIITNLLKGELEFSGLVITDALNMKGVANYLPAREIPLAAYKAGCDIILMPEDVQEAISLIESAVKSGEISLHSLNMRCRKILSYKQKLGLFKRREVETKGLYKELNKAEYYSLINRISENSITLVLNRENNLPITDLEDKKIAYLGLGGDRIAKEFSDELMLYTQVDTLILRKNYSISQLSDMLDKANRYSKVIIGIHNTDSRPQRGFGINPVEIDLLTKFAEKKDVTLVYFGNPLALPFINNYQNFSSIIVAYSNTLPNNRASAQMIFGGIPALGSLPVKAGILEAGSSQIIDKKIRISYGMPEDFNLGKSILENPLDSIINSDLNRGFFSGAQLILLHKGRVIIHKTYGDVSIKEPLRLNRISELVTTLPAIIKLSETGKLSLEGFLEQYIKLKKSSKDRKILISDLLMHRSGVDGDELRNYMYSQRNIEYMNRVIETTSGEHLYDLAYKQYFNPLGMSPELRGKSLYANVNDLAKFVSMLASKGSYANSKYFEPESVDLIKEYKHYYSTSLNGSLVWTDDNMETIFIFLNNGADTEENSKRVETGTKIRRIVSDVL